MSGKEFLDSNILVYCVDEDDKTKQQTARELIASLINTRTGRISTQTLQEFFNVSVKKLKRNKSTVQKDVTDFADVFPVHINTVKDILTAITISIKNQLSFYDSLIIAAAKAEGCEIVYSEDLNDGQEMDGVKIVNPFRQE